MTKYLPLVLVNVMLNSLAQISLKYGMLRIGHFEFSMENVFPTMVKIIQSPFVVGGAILFFLSFSFWLIILSRVELSWVYPMISLSYVLVAFLAWGLFHENLSLVRMLGILLICSGVGLITRT